MKKRTTSPRAIIRIRNSQKKITINKKKIIALAKEILKIKGVLHAELSILFAGKGAIRRLNKKFRSCDRPTDCLAFAMREGKDCGHHPEILGDVVICPQIARVAARQYGTSKEKELYLYLIHGILHLLGYTDSNPQGRAQMEQEQKRILKRIGHE